MTPIDTIVTETGILEALRDSGRQVWEVRAAIASPQLPRPFVLLDNWAGVVRCDRLDPERRLAALEVYLLELIHFPLSEADFRNGLTELFGTSLGAGVDMTMASFLPIDRNHGERIVMLPLPIDTGTGMASVYYAVEMGSDKVLRAGVYPVVEPPQTVAPE